MQGKELEAAVMHSDPRAWMWAWLRPHLPSLSLALLLMLAQSLATLLQPWLGGVLTDRLMLNRGLGPLLWVLFGLVCAQQVLGYVVSLQLQKTSGRLVADASAEIYSHLQALPLGWHQERRRGDVLALLTGDVYRVSGYVTGTLLPLIPLLFTLIGALVMMFRQAPLIAVTVAVLMPLMFVALKLFGRRLRPLAHVSAQAWADQSTLAEQNMELLPVVKAFATEQAEAANFRDKAEAVYAINLRLARLQGAISPVVYMIGAGAVLLLLGVGGHLIVRDEMRMGELVSLFLYGMVLVNPIGQLATVYGATQAARGTVQRLLEALSAQPEIDEGVVEQLPRGDIQFEAVDFAYPGRPALFQDFDLRIRAGETIALTGINGAGKSTLVQLLLRLVEPTAGRIAIGGIDLRDFRLEALRGQIGLVAQQVLLFNASVADNIAYGQAKMTRGDIERAARSARAHDFILALPDGYETVIGDQGVKLSGGQKQRLVLARALLKEPTILILDEATAMFDPHGEAEFIEECKHVLQERTVILITHRPASLALADRVLRLEGGRLHPVSVAC
jgi:ATP-binding cassette subfamily B protein